MKFLGKKKLIFVVLGVLILVGGAGFLVLGKGGSTKQPAKPVKPKVISYVNLEPFVVNLKGGVNFLKVTMSLEVEGKKGNEVVSKEIPILRNQIIFLLTEKTYEEMITSEGKALLQQEILKRVNRALEEKGVKEVKVTGVYFTDFIVQ
jgi:flagellar FliL protein